MQMELLCQLFMETKLEDPYACVYSYSDRKYEPDSDEEGSLESTGSFKHTTGRSRRRNKRLT